MVSLEQETARLEAIQTFTDIQIRWLSLIPIIPALFSLFGSICIVSDIHRRRPRQRQRQRLQNEHRYNPTTSSSNDKQIGPYERLMLGMSLQDILYTLVFVISPFMTGPDSWWFATSSKSFGGPLTCRIVGTLSQFALSNQLYYGMLSYYFLLTIRYQISHEKFARRYEIPFHIFAIGWPLITAIIGAIVDWYDVLELFPGCWIDNYPKGCVGDCISPEIAYGVYGTVTIFTTLSLIINYILISCYIRRRYNRHQFRIPNTATTVSESEPTTTGTTATTIKNFISWSTRTLTSTISSTTTTPPPQQQRSTQRRQRRRSLSNDYSGAFTNSQNQQQKRSNFVAVQASFYIGTYFVTYVWFNLLQIVEGIAASDRPNFPAFPFMICQAIFSPLAGFWNCMIYFRPRYLQLKSEALRRHDLSNTTNQRRAWSEDLEVESDDGGRTIEPPPSSSSHIRIIYATLFGSGTGSGARTITSPINNRQRRRGPQIHDGGTELRQESILPTAIAKEQQQQQQQQQQWTSGHFLKRMASIVSEDFQSIWLPSSSSSSPSSASSSPPSCTTAPPFTKINSLTISTREHRDKSEDDDGDDETGELQREEIGGTALQSDQGEDNDDDEDISLSG